MRGINFDIVFPSQQKKCNNMLAIMFGKFESIMFKLLKNFSESVLQYVISHQLVLIAMILSLIFLFEFIELISSILLSGKLLISKVRFVAWEAFNSVELLPKYDFILYHKSFMFHMESCIVTTISFLSALGAFNFV